MGSSAKEIKGPGLISHLAAYPHLSQAQVTDLVTGGIDAHESTHPHLTQNQLTDLTDGNSCSSHKHTRNEFAFLQIDGGGSVITTGSKAWYHVPFAATITEWTILADRSGSITLDIWKDTYANFPPTNADSITASAKPALSSAVKATSSTLTGWTTGINAGDILYFEVETVSTVQRITLTLKLAVTE
jgi:hypothetical protein